MILNSDIGTLIIVFNNKLDKLNTYFSTLKMKTKQNLLFPYSKINKHKSLIYLESIYNMKIKSDNSPTFNSIKAISENKSVNG